MSSFVSCFSSEKQTVSKRKHALKIYKDFTFITYDHKDHRKCNYCSEILATNSTHKTSHLIRHRGSCLWKEIHYEKLLSFGLSTIGESSLCMSKFYMDNILYAFMKCFVMHEIPFNYMKYDIHRKYNVFESNIFSIFWENISQRYCHCLYP